VVAAYDFWQEGHVTANFLSWTSAEVAAWVHSTVQSWQFYKMPVNPEWWRWGGVAKVEPVGRSLISRLWVPYKDMKDARDEICRLEVCFGPSHSYLHRGLCQLAAVLKGRL
jgi:hypothetical protein